MHFTFGTPWLLALLFLIPCFWLCKTHTKRFYFSKADWIPKHTSWFTAERWIAALIFALLIIASADPFVYDARGHFGKKGRDLVLALDASGSMAQSGYDTEDRFRSKYDTVLLLAERFVKERADDNMGVVIFGSFAYTAAPLTYDLQALRYLLQTTDVGIAGESTAIGDALMQSLRTLSLGEAKKKVVVLMTDGHHNAGSTSPKEAVEKAKKSGVKIYTVGIGSRGEYDEGLLRKIAKETNGKHYGAPHADALKGVFDDIAALEPSSIRSENYLNRRSVVMPILFFAALLLAWQLFAARRSV